MNNDTHKTEEELQPLLVDFREFSHIATELGRPIYADWFEISDEHNLMVKQARQLSHHALRILQWENGSQENERISVAVIGDFSSGKSSFINSLLGQKICPVDVAASTSSITTFKYGDDEAIYKLTDKGEREAIDPQKYKEWVTHQGQNKEKVDNARYEFEIYYPFDGFRDVELYDTPGFNNAENRQDEEITLEKCRSADVILFVFDINKGDLPADILNKVLRPLRREKPDQPMIAIVNKADTKPPSKVKEIRDGIHAKNVFNQVLEYSALEEMSAWEKIEVPALPESILEVLGKASACKIEASERGFILTPLNPNSDRKKAILLWMQAIRGQKAKFIKVKRQSELNEYYHQGELLLKTLQKCGKSCKTEDEGKSVSIKEQLKKIMPNDNEGEVRKALSIALSSAVLVKEKDFWEIVGSAISRNTKNWRVRRDDSVFDYELRKSNEFKRVKNRVKSFTEAIKAIQIFPAEISTNLDQLCSALLFLLDDPVELFKPTKYKLQEEVPNMAVNAGMEHWSSEDAESERRQKINSITEHGANLFNKRFGDLMNKIQDQLDQFYNNEALLSVAANARSETFKIFITRVKEFSDVFWSRDKSALLLGK